MASVRHNKQQRIKPITKQRQSNHWKCSISVMGATPKQRSIYINTWIDIKVSAKKKQAIRTAYGQYFHIKHASDTISLDLYVHDIQNNLQIADIWDSIVLNVIVLPFNHTNYSVDKPLKQLIHELAHTKVPLRKLFSKTLLICPSNFSSMNREQFLNQSKRVSKSLLKIILNGLGPSAKTLNLLPSDIVMMESGRKSSVLPTGKDWRINAIEYALKHLIFSDRDRKAFIAWVLNMPNPLKMENIRFISQRLKEWKTSRRRGKTEMRHSGKNRRAAANKQGYDRKLINIEKGSLRKVIEDAKTKGQRPKLSLIVRDFEQSHGIEATIDNEYNRRRTKRERNVHNVKNKHNVKKVRRKKSKYDDEKLERMDPSLAAILNISDDDDSETNAILLNKINKATHAVNNTSVKTKKEPEKIRRKKEKESESEEDSKSATSDDEEDESTQTDSEEYDGESESESEDDASDEEDEETESEEEDIESGAKHKRDTKELKRFCKNANLSRYYDKMVKLGFNSSAEFLDLDNRELDEMIEKLEMVFKDDKQFRKCVNSAKIACGIKEEQHRHNVVNRMDLGQLQHDSFSSLSDLVPDDEVSSIHFYDSMEPGISKMALMDLNKKCTEFTKINRKCGDSLKTLHKSYREAQSEIDRIYCEYRKQIEIAQRKAIDSLKSFVHSKEENIGTLRETMKSAVSEMRVCETECDKMYKNGKQDEITSLVNKTMRAIKLPSDFSVASGKFDVDFVTKLDIFPPVLQPDDSPFYVPKLLSNNESNKSSHRTRSRTVSRGSHQSQHSVNSLQDIIENNGVIVDEKHLSSSPLMNMVASPQNIQSINKKQPQIRRNSVVLGDIDLSAVVDQNRMSPPPLNAHPLMSPPAAMNAPLVPMNTPYSAASAAAAMMNPYMMMNQQQMMVNQQMMHNPYQQMMVNQYQLQHAHQLAQQAAATQQAAAAQQQQSMINVNGDKEVTNALIMSQHNNTYEWLETVDLWRGGRVIVEGNTVTVANAACVVADIEIINRNQVFCWEIYVEKISNRCWIGIIPGPISSINWKIGECPPTEPKSIGLENTYGFIYCGGKKYGPIGRAPRNRDHIRFKLDTKNKVLYGSLNDQNVDNEWYKGDDIPEIACIVIINSTGKGKFQIRHN